MDALMLRIVETAMAEPRSGERAKVAAKDELPGAGEMPALTPQQRSLVVESMTARLDYVPHDLFEQAGAERELFGQSTDLMEGTTNWHFPRADQITAGAARSVRLTPAQEKYMFLRYNFARSRAQAAAQVCRIQPDLQTQRRVALWYGRVRAAREIITRANLALVLSMGKRMRNSYVDFDELVSEGNMALMRALEKFDVSRGFKFSTYACRAIVQSFGRLGMKNRRYHRMFLQEFDPDMEKSNQLDWQRAETESDALEELRRIIRANKAQLSAIEQRVIRGRFAIDRGTNAVALTLEEMGRVIGLTKERVRQIQNQALTKLRLKMEGSNGKAALAPRSNCTPVHR